MRDAWRLVEPIVLGRVAARVVAMGLCALLVQTPAGEWPLVAVGALAAGLTPLVERSAVLRDLERKRVSLRAGWEAALGGACVAALALVQLTLFDPRIGVGPEAHTNALAQALGGLRALPADEVGRRALGWALAALLLGAPCGALALDRVQRTKPDPVSPALWLLGVAALAGLAIVGIRLLTEGPRQLADSIALGLVASVAFGVLQAFATLCLYLTDRTADLLVGLCGIAPSAVETPGAPLEAPPPGPPFT